MTKKSSNKKNHKKYNNDAQASLQRPDLSINTNAKNIQSTLNVSTQSKNIVSSIAPQRRSSRSNASQVKRLSQKSSNSLIQINSDQSSRMSQIKNSNQNRINKNQRNPLIKKNSSKKVEKVQKKNFKIVFTNQKNRISPNKSLESRHQIQKIQNFNNKTSDKNKDKNSQINKQKNIELSPKKQKNRNRNKNRNSKTKTIKKSRKKPTPKSHQSSKQSKSIISISSSPIQQQKIQFQNHKESSQSHQKRIQSSNKILNGKGIGKGKGRGKQLIDISKHFPQYQSQQKQGRQNLRSKNKSAKSVQVEQSQIDDESEDKSHFLQASQPLKKDKLESEEDMQTPFDGPQYSVEKIVSTKQMNGQLRYQVKWVGYPDDQNTYQPLRNLDNVMGMVVEYQKSQKIKFEKLFKQKSRLLCQSTKQLAIKSKQLIVKTGELQIKNKKILQMYEHTSELSLKLFQLQRKSKELQKIQLRANNILDIEKKQVSTKKQQVRKIEFIEKNSFEGINVNQFRPINEPIRKTNSSSINYQQQISMVDQIGYQKPQYKQRRFSQNVENNQQIKIYQVRQGQNMRQDQMNLSFNSFNDPIKTQNFNLSLQKYRQSSFPFEIQNLMDFQNNSNQDPPFNAQTNNIDNQVDNFLNFI